MILASWDTRGCSSGFPITSPIQHEKPFNLEICVSVVGTTPICLLSPPEKPIMRMLDARIGDREAQEFVRRLKEIEKSMEEEWKLPVLPVLVFSDHVLQHVLLYWYDVYNIWIFFSVLVCLVTTPKWKEKTQRSLPLFSNWEMNILSLCNPTPSQLNYILEVNG